MRSYGLTNAAPYASAPAPGTAGDIYWNIAEKSLYGSDGVVWNKVGPSSGDLWTAAGATLRPADTTKTVSIPGDVANAGALILGAQPEKARLVANNVTPTGKTWTAWSLNRDPFTGTIDDDVATAWQVSLRNDAGNDAFTIGRQPAGGAIVNVFTVNTAGQAVVLGPLSGGTDWSQIIFGTPTAKGRLHMETGGRLDLMVNAKLATAWASDDTARSSWLLGLGSSDTAAADAFTLFHAPATTGAPTWANFLSIAGDGRFLATVPTGDYNAFHIKGTGGGSSNLVLDTPARAGIWFGDTTQGNARYFVGHESSGGSTAPWRVYATGGGSRISVWPGGQVCIGTSSSSAGQDNIGGNYAYELIINGDMGMRGPGNFDHYNGIIQNFTNTANCFLVPNANISLGWYAAGHGALYNTQTGVWFHLFRASDNYQWINYGGGVGASTFDVARSEIISCASRHAVNAYGAGTYNLSAAHYYVIGWPDSGPGRVNFYLPVASGCVGRIYYFIQWGGGDYPNDVVIWPTGSDNISGASYVQLKAHQSKTILLAINFGVAWFKLL